MTETRREILHGLELLSDRYAEMRFGQLIVNIANWAAQQPDAIWDVEDEDFLNAITGHLTRTASTTKVSTRHAG